MPEPTHSPYNFVPLPGDEPERKQYPGLDRIGKDSLSGVLACELEVLTSLFTADHQHAKPWAEGDDRRIFPFLKDSNGNPILQATTLKGMIRAVFEAAFPSCLPLAAVKGSVKRGGQSVSYSLALKPSFDHKSCDRVDQLCPACRLFGITQGDEVHAQGRAFFSDARLSSGDLQQEEIKLAELSTPKPYHYDFYSADGTAGGEIRGRKFFYHQDHSQPSVDTLSRRANAISEFAPEGRRFTFTVRFENLTQVELKRLVACLVLDDQHAHKLGMAKPLGFGSCQIRILEEGSSVDEGGSRYRTFPPQESKFKASDWVLKENWLKGDLEEILRWKRKDIGPIGYLPYGAYRGKGIGKHGKYERSSSIPSRRSQEPEPPPAKNPTGTFSGIPTVSAPPKSGPPKPRHKATLEVIKHEGGIYTLRDPETGQDDIKFRGTGVPWRVGDPVKVRIIETTRDGRIKKIGPG